MNDLSWIEIIYWGSTIIGGTLFLLRTILLLVGGGIGQEDFDTHFEGEIQIGHDIHLDADHVDTYADSDFTFGI